VNFFRSAVTDIGIESQMTLSLEPRSLNILFHVDTNLINARQKLAAVNQLEKWRDDEVILINMSSTAHVEAQADGNAIRTRKANQFIFTATAPMDSADELFKKVEDAFFPNGASNENQRNDVRIGCEAVNYGAILVTGDGGSKSQPGGILGNRHKLKGVVTVFSPEEAVNFVREKIRERDKFNLEFVRKFGGTIPEWTGLD
jgi:hypothetical protein